MAITDPYATLGVSRSASPDEIKQAYRKLSKEWHPDKHKGDKAAEDKFKQINEAYETLSDPQKKQMFDQFGRTSGSAGGAGPGGFDFSGFSGGNGGMDFSDMFESFFGANRQTAANRDRGQDREIEVQVDLIDVVKPVAKTINQRSLKPCKTCDGSGAEPGSKLVTCDQCSGTGQVVRSTQSFFGTIQQRTMCPKCKGSGKVPEKPCRTCGGEGRTADTQDITIQIPAGIEDGQTLRVTGGGDAGRRSGASGDLYVHVRVRPDPRFERDGADIRTEAVLHVLDAMLGTEIETETVHGPVRLAVPAGTQPGQILRIKGKGMPVLSSSRTGDHYVTIVVDIPKKLSRDEKRIMEEWREARGD